MRSSKLLAFAAAVSMLAAAFPFTVSAEQVPAADNAVTGELTENKDGNAQTDTKPDETTSRPSGEDEAQEDTKKTNDFDYRVTADGKVIITNVVTDKTSFTIPSSVSDKGTVLKVVGVDDFAFLNCENAEKISVPASLTLENTGNAAFLTAKAFNGFMDSELGSSASFTEVLRYVAKKANYKNGNFTDDDLADVSVKLKNKLDKVDISKEKTVKGKVLRLIRNVDKMELDPVLKDSFDIWVSSITYGGLTLCGRAGIPMEQYAQGRKLLGMDYLAQTDLLAGDANGDGKVNVRDAAFIASKAAKGTPVDYADNPSADYNGDGKVNVRDAAALARTLAGGTKK